MGGEGSGHRASTVGHMLCNIIQHMDQGQFEGMVAHFKGGQDAANVLL